MHPAERRSVEVELDEQLVDERERFRAPQQVREEAPLHGRPEREVVVDVELERDEVILDGVLSEPLEDVFVVLSADVDGGSVDVDRSDFVCRRSVQTVRFEYMCLIERRAGREIVRALSPMHQLRPAPPATSKETRRPRSMLFCERFTGRSLLQLVRAFRQSVFYARRR